MSSIPCTFEEFKHIAKDFHVNAPTLNLDELDNAWKCLHLAYLGMHEEMWIGSAAIVLQMMTPVYIREQIRAEKEQE